jgi:peptidoglycan/xylan/chitin deacetylase (PgdA/CDA1 family)
VTQIEATEAVLSDLRTEAGCTNHPRLFRFPYGDKGFGIGPGRVLLSRLHPKVRALQKYLRVHQFRSTLDLGIQIPRPRFPYTLTTLDQDWLWGSDSRDWFFSKSGQSPGAYTHWMSENFPAVPPSDEFRVFLFHDHPGHPAYLQSVLPLLAARFSFVLPKESP